MQTANKLRDSLFRFNKVCSMWIAILNVDKQFGRDNKLLSMW